MSGPIVPPLQVTEVDGSPDGRPITKIIVSNGDLTISGRTATIDTSGSATTPGGSDTEIQFNDGGAFGGDAGFTMNVEGGGGTTVIRAGNMLLGVGGISTASLNGFVFIESDGTGEIFLNSGSEQGGTYTDTGVNIMCNTDTDTALLRFRTQVDTDTGSISLDGTGDLVINNNVATNDIDLKVLTTGQVEVANQTTNTASVLSIMGNGTGDARLDMQNASKRVWVVCDENKKLKVQGGSGGDTFVFDVSSASGGITFPDSTTQTTAASGGGIGGSITDNQIAVGATSADEIEGDSDFTFDAATNTLTGASTWILDTASAGGSLRFLNGGNASLRVTSGGPQSIDGNAAIPGYAFQDGYQMGMFRAAAETLGFTTSGAEKLRIDSNGAFGIVGANYGNDGQVLTSGGSGAAVAWEDAALSTTAHATPPANAADTGTAGQVAYDDDYVYICTATDTWKRTAVSTW